MEDVLDATVEPLDHAVGLGRFRRGQTMLDIEGRTKPVELVLAGRSALAQTEEAICEFLAIVREYSADADRAGPFQVTQEAPRIGRGLGLEDADEDPTCGSVDGNEQLSPRGFLSHLGQIFDVHVQIAGLICLERLMLRTGIFRLQVVQIAHAMTAQAAVAARARDLRVQELPDRRQQVIERH